MLDELVKAAGKAMAQAGCDDTCRCAKRLAFATWWRLKHQVDSAPIALEPIDQVLADVEARAHAAFGHAPSACPQSYATPYWRPSRQCQAAA